jgi:hypothetical protein
VLGFRLYPRCRSGAGPRSVTSTTRSRSCAARRGQADVPVDRGRAHEQPCRNARARSTAATVRAEAWLSIAGGGTGVGYFPTTGPDSIGTEITRTDRQIRR